MSRGTWMCRAGGASLVLFLVLASLSNSAFSATISGRVSAQQGDAPLPGVKVCATHPDNANAADCQAFFGHTNSEGNYSIAGLEARAGWIVWTSDLGSLPYFPEAHANRPCTDCVAGVPADFTPVDLSSQDAVVNMQLARSAMISGRITDAATGQPIAGVYVGATTESCRRNANPTPNLRTDADGRYWIPGLHPGIHFVATVVGPVGGSGYINEIFPDGKHVSLADVCNAGPEQLGQPIAVGELALIGDVDFRLDPGARIEGRIDINAISAAGGNARAHARLYDPVTGSQLLASFTNVGAGNTYAITGLLPGQYQVVLASSIAVGPQFPSALIDQRYEGVTCPRNSCPGILGRIITVKGTEAIRGVDARLKLGPRLHGRVADAVTGEGVPSMTLGIYDTDGDYASFGTTDQSGNWASATGLPDGSYTVSTQVKITRFDKQPVAYGYLPQMWKADGSFGACGFPCDFTVGDPVVVQGGAGVDGIDLEVVRGGVINGMVSGQGQPLGNVAVVLLNAASGSLASEVVTAPTGAFSFPGVPAGDYFLKALGDSEHLAQLLATPTNRLCAPSCSPFDGRLLELSPDETINGLAFDLPAAARVSGRVLDPLDLPVGGVGVEVVDTLRRVAAFGFTDELGQFRLSGLRGGQHYLRTRNKLGHVDVVHGGLPCVGECDPSSGQAASLTQGQELSGIELQLLEGVSLEGQVLQPAGSGTQPLAGVRVQVWATNGTLAAEAVSDINGEYTIDGLLPRSYHVVTTNASGFVNEDWAGNVCHLGCDPLNTPAVTFSAGSHSLANFTLEPGRQVFVEARLANGAPVAGLEAVLVDTSGRELLRRSTDTSGRVALTGLAAGQYFLRTVNQQGLQDQAWDGLACAAGCDPLLGRKVRLDTAPSASASFIMAPGLALSGRVTDTTAPGTGIGNVDVELLRSGVPVQTLISGGDGRFSFTGLIPGEYRLVTRGRHGYINRVHGGGTCTPQPCNLASGTAIVLAGQDVSGIGIALQAGYRLGGAAEDGDGLPLGAGSVSLYSSTGAWLHVAPVLPDSTFDLGAVAAGTYYLLFSSPYQTVADTLYNGVACSGGSCDILSGTPVQVGAPASVVQAHSTGTTPRRIRNFPHSVSVTIIAEGGHAISGRLVQDDNMPVADAGVYFFNDDGQYAGQATSDGEGFFTSDAGFPDGTWFAATSRPSIPTDTLVIAEAAGIGVGEELLNQTWDGFSCAGPCAPSTAAANGTPINVSGDAATGIDFVLQRAPGVRIETRVQGTDADTPGAGDAPAIAVGDTVSWSYHVTNTGPATLSGITVSDSNALAVSCPKTSLAAEESMLCTASTPAIDLAPAPQGSVIGICSGTKSLRLWRGTGTSSGTSQGTVVSDQDDGHWCNPPSSPPTINAAMNDAWYFRATSGQGFVISVFEERQQLFLAWFTFDADLGGGVAAAQLGSAEQRWLTAQGAYTGNKANLTLYSSSGGEFDQAAGVATAAVGTAVLEFDSCTSGRLSYDLPALGRQGVIPVQRILADKAAACEQRGAVSTQSTQRHSGASSPKAVSNPTINWGMGDAWYNGDTSGQGMLMTVFPSIGQMFVAWFTYDTVRPASGAPAALGEAGHRWLTAQGPFNGNRAELKLFNSDGGRFDSAADAVSSVEIGTLVLEFADCETAIATYEVPELGLSGDIPLQRIVADGAAICEALATGE